MKRERLPIDRLESGTPFYLADSPRIRGKLVAIVQRPVAIVELEEEVWVQRGGGKGPVKELRHVTEEWSARIHVVVGVPPKN